MQKESIVEFDVISRLYIVWEDLGGTLTLSARFIDSIRMDQRDSRLETVVSTIRSFAVDRRIHLPVVHHAMQFESNQMIEHYTKIQAMSSFGNELGLEQVNTIKCSKNCILYMSYMFDSVRKIDTRNCSVVLSPCASRNVNRPLCLVASNHSYIQIGEEDSHLMNCDVKCSASAYSHVTVTGRKKKSVLCDETSTCGFLDMNDVFRKQFCESNTVYPIAHPREDVLRRSITTTNPANTDLGALFPQMMNRSQGLDRLQQVNSFDQRDRVLDQGRLTLFPREESEQEEISNEEGREISSRVAENVFSTMMNSLVQDSMELHNVQVQNEQRIQNGNRVRMTYDESLRINKELCAVCMDRNCNTIFECNHLICLECCQRMNENGQNACHICRSHVESARWNIQSAVVTIEEVD